MHGKTIAALILFIFIIGLGQNAVSQETKDTPAVTEKEKSKEHVTVTVTAFKTPKEQKEITQKVAVIDALEIDRIPTANRNIAEILRYQPGMFVNVLSRNDANWGSYGGLGPKYNSYLLDGLPIDSFIDTMSLDPWAFKRIESQRGPASVMYSNYASMDFAGNQTPLAGVTNLILKEEIDEPVTRMLLGYGTFNTFNGRFYNQGRKGGFNYFLGLNYEQSDYTNYGTTPSWLNILKDPAYKKTKFYAKTTYFINRPDHKIAVFAHHTTHSGDAGRPNRDYLHNYDTINALYSNQIDTRTSLQFKAGYRNYDRRWGEDNYPLNLALREHDGVNQEIYPTDLTVNINHSDTGLLTAGFDTQYGTYRTYSEVSGIRMPGNKAETLAAGAYIQEKYSWQQWVFRVGGRINRTRHTYDLIGGSLPGLTEKAWNKFLWSAGLRYNASTNLSLYANAGTSFTPPSAKSVGGTLRADDIGKPGRNGQLPNPDLEPEHGRAVDAGVDFVLPAKITLGARFFLNQINDAIVENVVSQDPSQSISVNAGRAQSYGVEIPFNQEINDNLHWFANLTIETTDITNPMDPDQDGANLSFVPRYLANVGITCLLPHEFSVSPYLHAVGKYYDGTSRKNRRSFGDDVELDLRVQKPLSRIRDAGVLFNLDLNNLADNRYEMPWQFRNIGFNMLVGLEFVF